MKIGKIWKENDEKEKALMEIFNILPENLKDDCIRLREKYRNGELICGEQEEIETDLKTNLSKGLISVKNAYIVSNANNCYGIWENCIDG